MTTHQVQTDRAQFDEFFEAKLAKGLSDTKFFVSNVSESTLDSFLKESNEVDRALTLNEYVSLEWADKDTSI